MTIICPKDTNNITTYLPFRQTNFLTLSLSLKRTLFDRTFVIKTHAI